MAILWKKALPAIEEAVQIIYDKIKNKLVNFFSRLLPNHVSRIYLHEALERYYMLKRTIDYYIGAAEKPVVYLFFAFGPHSNPPLFQI